MSWEQVKLGDIFEIARGGSPRPIDQYITDDPNGLNWISIKDASNSSKYIYKTEKKIKPEGLHKTRLVHPNDFLLTNSMSFGRPYIMKTTGCIHDGWLVLSADKTKVDTDYFYHLLGSDFMYRKFKGLAAGAVVKNLNTELVKSVSVPLPPLSEQCRIASILDQADELRQKRQQAIEKLNQLLQATFIDMFGDPVSNPKGFEVKKLSEQVDLIQIGPFGTQLHQEDYIENGIPLINPSHIKNGKIIPNHKLTVSQSKYEELTQYHLRLNDVLLGRRGEMGRCAVVTENEVGWLCGTGSLFLRPNLEKINPFFLELLLSSDSIKRYLENVSQGQTMANLNKTIVGSIPLISPSIEIQNKFFLIAEKIDKMKTELKSAKNQVNNLFSSLQNQAFNGTL